MFLFFKKGVEKFDMELELLNEASEIENLSLVFEKIIDFSLGELERNKEFVLTNLITLLFLSIKNNKICNEVIKHSFKPASFQKFFNFFDDICQVSSFNF